MKQNPIAAETPRQRSRAVGVEFGSRAVSLRRTMRGASEWRPGAPDPPNAAAPRLPDTYETKRFPRGNSRVAYVA
jgi:hypothetical protein